MDPAQPTQQSQGVPYKFGDYIVLDILGQGFFGIVATCFKPPKKEVVAVKVLKHASGNLENEVRILQDLSLRQLDQHNIVKFIDYFTDNDFKCMVFETLDMSLLDFMEQRRRKLTLNELRPVTKQLLVAFEALGRAGIVHADLKPDNIMLVNRNRQPFKVKLIDFGCACYSSDLTFDKIIQPWEYRAPEASLGGPVSNALDMWSLGCTLAECVLGFSIFNGGSYYNNLRSIFNLVGHPSRDLLEKSEMCQRYFVQTDDCDQWRFRTPAEYHRAVGTRPCVTDAPLESYNNLESVFEEEFPRYNDPDYRDQMAFVDLLKQLLQLDPDRRITPTEALSPRFVTMEHLVRDESQYSMLAHSIMDIALQDSTPVLEVNQSNSSELQTPHVVEAKEEYPASSLIIGNKYIHPRLSEVYPMPPDAGGVDITFEPSGPMEQMYGDEIRRAQIPESSDKHIHEPPVNMDIQPAGSDYCINMELIEPNPIRDEPSENGATSADEPGHVSINIPDDTEDKEDPYSANKSAKKSFSIGGLCKTAAFGGLLTGQGLLCYMMSSSPIISGAVVLPMFLWGCADNILSVRKNY